MLCDIYRCSNREGMYLYVGKPGEGNPGADNDPSPGLNPGLEALPEALKKRAGRMERVMTLTLTNEKKLARVRAEDVMAAIEHQGFYLQIPPASGAEEAVV